MEFLPKLYLLQIKKSPDHALSGCFNWKLTALKFGAAHWTRTSDHLLRRQMLYPSELVPLKKNLLMAVPKAGYKIYEAPREIKKRFMNQ